MASGHGHWPHGKVPWPMPRAIARCHGQRPSVMAMARGQRPWPLAMANGNAHGQGPVPLGGASGHGHWPSAMALVRGQCSRPCPAAMTNGHRQWPMAMTTGQGQGPWPLVMWPQFLLMCWSNCPGRCGAIQCCNGTARRIGSGQRNDKHENRIPSLDPPLVV